MKTINYKTNQMKYHTRWLESFVSEFFDILNIGDQVDAQVCLLELSESDKELCIGNYRETDNCLKKDLDSWIMQKGSKHFHGETYIFSKKFTYEDIKGNFVIALKYNDTKFEDFIKTYLDYMVNHLLCLLEQTNVPGRETCDDAANLSSLIYLWSREFVHDKIFSNSVNLSQVSRSLELTAVEAIADMKYESADVSGKYIAVSSCSDKCEIKLDNADTKVRLNETKKIRKLLEITYQSGDEGLYLSYNRNFIEGFISPKNLTGEYYLIEFLGSGRWRFGRGSGTDCRQRIEFGRNHCIITYPFERHCKKFERCFKDIFGMNDSFDMICKIFSGAICQKHGTMLVFVEDAEEESKRLKHAGFSVDIDGSPEKYITQVTAIDGAVLLNEHGRIYAIGTILDGRMPEGTGFDMSRGARYNSAVKYSSSCSGKNLCVVISEDGYVNFISSGKEI